MIRNPYTQLLLWLQSITFSYFLFLILLSYQVWVDFPLTLKTLNIVLANAGMMLIGFSFALSGLCYFWNIFDKYIEYRKFLGIIGFSCVLTHSLITLLVLTELFPFPDFYLSPKRFTSFSLGLLSLLILTGMTTISNHWALQKLGTKRWKYLLRTGYLAYLLAVVHTGFHRYPHWLDWFSKPTTLPPQSLLITLCAVGVFSLRAALAISLHKHQSTQTST